MNNEYMKRSEIIENGKLIGKINYKPVNAFIIMTVFGLILFFAKNAILTVLACLILLLTVCGMIFIKDRPVLEVYSDALILYDEKDETLAIRIPNKYINKWDVSSNGSFTTQIYLADKNNTIIQFECFSTGKVINLLKETMKEKQAMQIGVEIRKGKNRSQIRCNKE